MKYYYKAYSCHICVSYCMGPSFKFPKIVRKIYTRAKTRYTTAYGTKRTPVAGKKRQSD